MLSRFFLFACIAASLTSCGPDYLYSEEKKIENGQWAYRDTMDFSFTVTDTSQFYNLFADFEYVDTFPMQNVYLRLYTRFPDGKRSARVRSFDLFDAQGKTTGKCSGHTCTTRFTLQDKAYFNLPGTYTITLEQFTRRDPLPGISKAALAVEKTGEKRK
ncbi:MAG: gliding motility lipoprotein GldH [Bacteroidetes bacterium]|nr:gliding motility lipoprotein GldH [Bacteroidota bacterium]